MTCFCLVYVRCSDFMWLNFIYAICIHLFFLFQYRYHSDVYIFLKDVVQEMTSSFIAKVTIYLNIHTFIDFFCRSEKEKAI